MQRIAYQKLLDWKQKNHRKPLLLDGARQVGKTYLLEAFTAKEFKSCFKLDFLADRSAHSLFEGDLSAKILLDNIQLHTGQAFNPQEDILFFDEIGECPKALTSLKFFAEQMPEIHICASGSNIGLVQSFPVGKVEMMTLNPMNFYEFLLASNETLLIDAFEQTSTLEAAHQKLWQQLLDFFYVGGMPEAVKNWFALKDGNIIERTNQIKQIHRDLINGYIRDFGKYSGKQNAYHIESIFKNIPLQLSQYIDSSVKRYRFKDIIDKKKSYRDLLGPITFLEKIRLCHKNHPINGKPQTPLKAYIKDNIFKLFIFDIGILSHMSGLTYQDTLNYNQAFKGYIAENFVHNEMVVMNLEPTYSWTHKESEIEFIMDTTKGILPIEVKSGEKTKAKSLSSYINQYQAVDNLILSGNLGNQATSGNMRWPLYYTSTILKQLLP